MSVYLNHKEKRKIKERSGFIKSLLKFFREKLKKLPLPLNIKLNDEKSEIIAARFVLHSEDIKDAETDMELVKSLRQVADSSQFNVTVFNPSFPFFDQFLQVWPSTVKCLTVSTIIVLLVTFILIPNAKACLVLMLTIASIICQVCGFMVLWNVYLDVISLICLIMCIGFSVGMSFTESLGINIFLNLFL